MWPLYLLLIITFELKFHASLVPVLRGRRRRPCHHIFIFLLLEQVLYLDVVVEVTARKSFLANYGGLLGEEQVHLSLKLLGVL